MNFGSLYYLLILSDYFPELKQYLESVLLQQYPQLFWLSFWYGGSAVEAFKQLYGFSQPVYAQSAAPTAPRVSPQAYFPFAQQDAFANFLRLAFLQPMSGSPSGSPAGSTTGSTAGSTAGSATGSTNRSPTGSTNRSPTGSTNRSPTGSTNRSPTGSTTGRIRP